MFEVLILHAGGSPEMLMMTFGGGGREEMMPGPTWPQRSDSCPGARLWFPENVELDSAAPVIMPSGAAGSLTSEPIWKSSMSSWYLNAQLWTTLL